MDQLYRVSHLVIGRAGATSLAELSYFGLPAILIPYPYAGAHQIENAKIFEQEGAAVVLNGEMATADSMTQSLHTLVCSGERLHRMREASRRLAVPDAQERLREFIEEVI
jgi:UDP-N-acetylglucosamine--N-acetylmuramyl-(pentapeptide) pyrophosphoryl-undecaprenol N-acetylglucosamine transferase